MRSNFADFLLWLACLPLCLGYDLKPLPDTETTEIENILDSSIEFATTAKDLLNGVDKCAEEGFCSHYCHNESGSYRCACMKGYRLENRTCLAEGPEPLLVFSTMGDIRGRYLRSGRDFTIHLAVKKISAVDVDPADSTVYWTEPSLNGSSVYASKLDGTGLRLVLNKGLLMPEDIAVDYMGNNLYITDSYLKQVMACKQDGSLCYVLHSTEIEKPRAIALDPAEGLMYWSDWGDTAAGLYRSGMDGSRRIAMISKDIKWPNGIAIDHTTDRLYWCDAQLERIEYVSLDGRARKIVLQYHVPNPYSLAVFEDTLYWSDWATLSLNSCNKFTGHNQTIIARANGKHIMGVHVYHPVLKKTKTTSSCHSNGGCSHLCLLTPEGRSCACPAEMLLSNDSATCETPPQRCPTNDFRCSNGRCILRSWLCDFRDDCGDNSDESDCSAPTGCAVDQFPCDNGECAQSLWRCDGEPDCADGSDESACHSTTCHDHQLRCDHGQCIPTSWVCDGAKDCLDGTDERNCFLNVPTCNEGQFRCDDGECIYKHEVCDGHDDCTKAEDELNCTAKAECSSEDFYCSDPRRCMPRRWLCDGDDDCADAFDEANCHRNRTPVAREGCEQFSCQSGECLPWSKVCDDYPNCGDSSDEGGSCSSSCQGGNGGCSQNCHKMPAGSRCSCFTGFELMPDGKTCEDIDECQVPGNCSQYCTNTKGSFKCACAPGYFLELDHKRCKADGGAATLMYLLPDQIKGIDLVSRAQRVYVSGGVTDMRGMDYDASEEIYFWTEWKESEIGFYTADTNRREILLRTLRQPNFLKWDYIAKNIYYTDSEGSILACRRDGKFCTIVVDRPASHINSLELDPMSGLMFWSVWSVVLKKSLGVIERAEMDGTKRTVIVSNNIYWPTAINVDRVLKYIYWTDAKLNRIEYADFNGLNRKEIVRDIPYYPFSMALFEDKVFWSDWGTDTIRHCNRFTGKNCATFHEGGVKAETIMIVHKAQQPKEENRCENAGCSHMCLLTRSGHSCRCAEGYQGLDSSCEFNATTPRPTTPQPQCPEGYCMRDAPCEMVDSYKLCKCQEPFDGARCEKYMVGMEPAYDYTWVVAVAIGLGMIVAIIIVVYLLGRKKRSMTQTALTVNLSAGRCTIQEIQLSSASSKLEKV